MQDFPSLTLSVLLVVHAQPHTLQPCVQSVAAEQMDAVELVIVDDASPQPISLDPGSIRRPVTLLRNTRRRGLGATRNLAASQALGEVLVFLASDVTLAPGSLRVIERAFLADPLLGVVVGETLGMATRSGVGPLHALDAGLIAVRASVFRDSGGFLERPGSLGTLEFVMRLAHAGVRIVLRPHAAVTAIQPETLRRSTAVAYRHGLAWMRLSPVRRGLGDLLSWGGLRDAVSPVHAAPARRRWRTPLERGLGAVAFSAGAVNAWLLRQHRDSTRRSYSPFTAAPQSTHELRSAVWRPAKTELRDPSR